MEIKIPSDKELKDKLKTRKASKRSPRRKFKVLTDKLAREHVRLMFKDEIDKVSEMKMREKAWKSLS